MLRSGKQPHGTHAYRSRASFRGLAGSGQESREVGEEKPDDTDFTVEQRSLFSRHGPRLSLSVGGLDSGKTRP